MKLTGKSSTEQAAGQRTIISDLIQDIMPKPATKKLGLEKTSAISVVVAVLEFAQYERLHTETFSKTYVLRYAKLSILLENGELLEVTDVTKTRRGKDERIIEILIFLNSPI